MTNATWLQGQARAARITALAYAVTAERRNLTDAELARLEKVENNLAYFEDRLQKATLRVCLQTIRR
jgi:hypothetical protein